MVDQGSDPLESRPRFAAVGERLGPRLRYVRQPNLGGAGGFTRGLFDATAGDPADDHDVLLMDDDVLLEPEILVRLTAFATCTTHPTIVGGQMLNLLHPAHLHISAEYAEPETLRVGRAVPGALKEAYLLGHDDRDLPTVQDQRIDTEYNGWWACLVPAAIVRAIGYPLPLFFQWDDIEFGYRARAHGFPTVALPGAGVWHADFGWKDWDEWHRYFNMRNGLITAALHTPFSIKRIGRTLGTLLAQYLVAMQYGLAATLIQAVDDFLDGPDVLRDGSAAAAAEIRRIRAAYPETQMRPVASVEGDFREMQVVRAPNEPGHDVLTWLKRVAYHLTDRAVHPTGMVVAGDAHWWHVSTFRRAIVTDMSEQGLRVRTRDRARALALAKRGAQVAGAAGDGGPEGRGAVPGGDGAPDRAGRTGPASTAWTPKPDPAMGGDLTRSAGVAPGVEARALADRAEPGGAGLGAEVGRVELVLRGEHGLAGVDERGQQVALLVLEALFVDREVEVVDQVGDLVEVVLQPDRQPALVGEVGEHPVVGQLVGRGQGEAGVPVVAVDQVGLDRVEALLAAQVEPRGHDRAQDVEPADVEQTFPGEAARIAQDGVREGGVVGPELLGRAHVDVADDLAPGPVQRRDRLGARLDAVDVEHVGVDARCRSGR